MRRITDQVRVAALDQEGVQPGSQGPQKPIHFYVCIQHQHDLFDILDCNQELALRHRT